MTDSKVRVFARANGKNQSLMDQKMVKNVNRQFLRLKDGTLWSRKAADPAAAYSYPHQTSAEAGVLTGTN